jgi:phage-related protein
MSEKPGWIRRVFRFIGKVVSALRQVISLIIVIFFITVIAGMFADDIQPAVSWLTNAPTWIRLPKHSLSRTIKMPRL